jgi:hypothetical protein
VGGWWARWVRSSPNGGSSVKVRPDLSSRQTANQPGPTSPWANARLRLGANRTETATGIPKLVHALCPFCGGRARNVQAGWLSCWWVGPLCLGVVSHQRVATSLAGSKYTGIVLLGSELLDESLRVSELGVATTSVTDTLRSELSVCQRCGSKLRGSLSRKVR